jgi:copper(I)-binding protein
MKSLVPILAAALALASCGSGSEPKANSKPVPMVVRPVGPPPPTETRTAFVRMPAVPGRPAAGYFDLRIEGDRGALVSVDSPNAGRIELHETMSSGNMTSMRPLERIPVRDGEMLSFRPGGRHLMLFDLDRTLVAGDQVILLLEFERGNPVGIAARLVPTGSDVGH